MGLHLVIAGPMGVGKSTTAERIAVTLGLPHRDSDVDIESAHGRTGADLARDLGVKELHRIEAEHLLASLANPVRAVISAAGSVVENPKCLEALGARAFVVVLTAPVDELMARGASAGHRRTMERSEVEAIAARRDPIMAELADLTLSATRPPDELARVIVNRWSASQAAH